ncbi:hypothetical protein BH23ACI1_BH23ACI1_02660 [soil metagenome]
MNNNDWVMLGTGAALGATAMCLLDPGRGARRRALVRDKAVRVTHKTGDALDALSRDAANRAKGLAAEAVGALRPDDADERTLVERVRSELGRVVSHPRAIDVGAAGDGRVHLSGPILAAEADEAVAATSAVRGVSSVDDRLERHETPEGVPSLQGGRTRPGRRSALLHDSWSPTTKALVCIASTAIAAGLGYATLAGEETH